MDTFEVAWFSSAFAFAYLVYVLEPFEPPRGPKDSLIPIRANGRDIRVPPAFVDITCDISKFATEFELALKKAVPGLKSSSGSLWTTRIVRGEKPELEKALRGVDNMRRDYSALLDQAVDAHNRGLKIEVDLKSYRKKQRTQMDEVQELMKEYWPSDSSWTLL